MADEINLSTPENVYQQPDYKLTVAGQDITPKLNNRLIDLRLREDRGEEADTLEITLNDSDGLMAIPSKGAEISLMLGYKGSGLIDKGLFTVDEVGHSGAPDQISISARSADMSKSLRRRATSSWHETTLGTIAEDIARRNSLQTRIAPELAAISVLHIDQTGESDMHFLTRLARQHDATATVKKGRLVVLPIGSTTTATGASIGAATLTRSAGDQHNWHSADRTSYSGVIAKWRDPNSAQEHTVIEGTEDDAKTLRDLYASEQAALEAVRAEMGRIERGEATLSITLAIGRPALMPQTPLTVKGFKPQIDGVGWLIKSTEHSLSDSGLTTKIEAERNPKK